MQVKKYKGLKNRILIDIDNERPYDYNIVGLSQSDEVRDFNGDIIILEEGRYIYTFTESIEGGVVSYIFAEGYVISSPYKDLSYKWCCQIEGEIEFIEDYNNRFSTEKDE